MPPKKKQATAKPKRKAHAAPVPAAIKKRRFIDAFVETMNLTKSAGIAGYSLHTAHAAGHRLFKDAEVRAEINRRFDELAMTAPEALRRLGDMGRCGSLDTADIMLAFARGGIVDAIEALRANPNAHLVKAMYETANGLRIEMHDAQAALDKILRVHGAYKDRTELTGKDGAPLIAVIDFRPKDRDADAGD